jgi:large repetitive protein
MTTSRTRHSTCRNVRALALVAMAAVIVVSVPFGGVRAQEVGTDDFRITSGGTDGDAFTDMTEADVAYNATNDEYLVVFKGDTAVDNRYEIWGQRVDADGSLLGSVIQISNMGPALDPAYDADVPAVAWDSVNNQYLVVWEASDNSGSLVVGENEIWGHILNGTNGATVVGQFRISQMGTDGDSGVDGRDADVAFGITQQEYLVVWRGDGGVDGADEIYGQRVTAAGALVGGLGTGAIRISDLGTTDTDIAFDAEAPAVAWGATQNEFCVVWTGDDDVNGLVDGETEVFAQFLQASTGAELGTNDLQISDVGGANGGTTYGAIAGVGIAYDATDDELLVVWTGDDNQGSWADGEYEVSGQRLDATTRAETGTNDFRITNIGTDGVANNDERAAEPGVAWDSADNRYLVVYRIRDTSTGLAANEREVAISALSNTGATLLGTTRISAMGTAGTGDVYDGQKPAAAYGGGGTEFLVVWQGDDDTGSLVDGEDEIYGQRISAASLPVELSMFLAE